ncbi:MAG: biopolymer transporter ExbD [Luteolibacter sp.]
MTLPERPGFLHAVPLFNLFALLLLLFVLGPSMIVQSGVSVELPPSRFQMERYENSVVVTVGAGQPEPRLHFGRDAVSQPELEQRLDSLREKGAISKTVVLMRTSADTPVSVERQIAEMILAKGFHLALVGKVESRTMDSKPIPKPDHGEVPDP